MMPVQPIAVVSKHKNKARAANSSVLETPNFIKYFVTYFIKYVQCIGSVSSGGCGSDSERYRVTLSILSSG